MFDRASIVITDEEKMNLEIAEYGLDRWESIGLQIIVYVNTERCCAKEMVLFEHQTCPEHRHPPMPGSPGKEETFRCRFGEVYLYVEGEATRAPKAVVPKGREPYFTARHEIVLQPGDQYTLMPDTLHWFQAGPEGAIISEFSTQSHDETDVFTDPEIVRVSGEV
ncbi:MAG: D-lyxose/D-mannose family sugar isomerase [Clostridiales bacterium]|nr:D-lyxose/D-mannose family sugar isomerase [Clostridiales bacterium]